MIRILRSIWQLLPDNFKQVIGTILGKDIVRRHPKAASSGFDMMKWADKIRKLSNINIQNIFEIGANYAQDAEFMRHYLKMKPDNVYIFEPHPQIIEDVRKYYEFNAYDYAISNVNGNTLFHAIDLSKSTNSGISSLLRHSEVDQQFYFDVNVKLLRMDSFMELNKISFIDFLKIDVEGCTYEVLEGFGEKLKYVKSIQLEAEQVKLYEGEKLFDEVYALLLQYDFIMAYFELLDEKQSDSLWIRREYLKH